MTRFGRIALALPLALFLLTGCGDAETAVKGVLSDKADAVFDAAVSQHGVAVTDALHEQAQAACRLIEQGKELNAAARELSGTTGQDLGTTGYVIAAAVVAYCPEYGARLTK